MREEAGAGGRAAGAGPPPLIRRLGLLPGLAAAVLAVVAYLPSLRNGFTWDDRPLIVENRALTRPGAAGLAFVRDFWESEEAAGPSDYYRPLVTVSYIANRSWFGLAPAGYHATNVLIHAGSTFLLFLLLTGVGLSAGSAFAGAALFAVHPAMAESVAWVSGRTDSLALLFMMGALAADRGRRGAGARTLAAVLLGAGLLSKEIAVTTPLLAAILDRARPGAPTGGTVGSIARGLRARPEQLALVSAYLVVRRVVLGAGVAHGIVPDAAFAFAARLVAIPHLAGILVAPPLSRIEYGNALPAGALTAGALSGVALAVFLAWSAARAADRRIGALAACGAVAALPSIAAIALKAVVADRMVYAPAAFLLPAAALAAGRLLPRPRVAAAALSVILAVAGAATWARCGLWRSERALFEAAVAAPHASARAWLNLGIADHDEGRLRESLEALDRATARESLKTAHYTRGLVFTEIGCVNLAEREYRAALSQDPGFAAAANNLGGLLAEAGRQAEAQAVLSSALAHGRGASEELRANLEAIRARPSPGGGAPPLPAVCASDDAARSVLSDARALNRRALDRLRARQLDQARILIAAALHRDPSLVAARLNLAQWHVLTDDPAGARAVLEGVLRDHPDEENAKRLLAHLE